MKVGYKNIKEKRKNHRNLTYLNIIVAVLTSKSDISSWCEWGVLMTGLHSFGCCSVPMVKWCQFGHLTTSSQLWHHKHPVSCNDHLQTSFTAFSKQSQWGSWQKVWWSLDYRMLLLPGICLKMATRIAIISRCNHMMFLPCLVMAFSVPITGSENH